MHKKTPAFFLLLIIFTISFSCKKSEEAPPVEPEIVSSISISYDVQKIQPYYLRFNEGFKSVAYLALDKHGTSKIVFAGKGGRNIASTIKERTDDFKKWHINDGDTIKIYTDNKLTKLFITAKKNFAEIWFYSPYTISNEEGLATLIDYVNNRMPASKFSFRE